MTSYTPEHEAGDLSAITIDVIVEGFIVVVSFASLIVLVLVWQFLRKSL